MNNTNYISRINRAIDYIERNIDTSLRLDSIAEAASFSKYHFHRIFRAFVGESPNSFIQRVRVEKAANMLLLNSDKSITEIALDCGFSGSSSFARIFKEIIGVSASTWRKDNSKNCKVESNIGKTVSKESKDYKLRVSYFNDSDEVNGTKPDLLNLNRRQKMKLNVKVNDLNDMPVVYVRHIGPYQGDSDLFGKLFSKLFKWAGAHGLLSDPDLKVMCVYHDNPDITDNEKLRTSVCLTAPDNTNVSGEIGKMVVEGGKYAMGHFRIRSDEYQGAWDAMYGEWLPDSGYQADDRPPFELCLNDPEKDPEGMYEVEICIPVIPL